MLYQHKKICEKVTITNCVLYSRRDYGIRIGVGDGLIRNCTISNVTVDAPNWIGILGRWSGESKTASSVANICISNANVHSRCPIEMCVAYGEKPLPHECFIRNIMMSNLMLITEQCNVLKGFSNVPLENISMNNVFIKPGDNADKKLFK